MYVKAEDLHICWKSTGLAEPDTLVAIGVVKYDRKDGTVGSSAATLWTVKCAAVTVALSTRTR